MIEPIKRVASRLTQRSASQVDLPMEIEVATGYESQQELLIQETVVQHTGKVLGIGTDYYPSLMQLAISQGGAIGPYRIPTQWLEMTLAGLEGKGFGIEEMWERLWLSEQPSDFGYPTGDQTLLTTAS